MADLNIQETQLPGVGVRHEMRLDTGERFGVITHYSGSRDLLAYDKDDPDMAQFTLHLNEGEARMVGQLLGASQVTQTMAEMTKVVEGVSIDWMPVKQDWECAGHQLSELSLSKTGVLVVAVVRDGETIPMPSPDFRLLGGDTAVVVGTPEGIKATYEDMHG
ncbi:MAG: TrkA C-terminal domain-containing protein [Chloroflexota bacterium]